MATGVPYLDKSDPSVNKSGYVQDFISNHPEYNLTSPQAENKESVLFKGDALSQLSELAKDHPEYMELYLQLLAERENTSSAQAWYEKMSGSQYQRAVKDLEAAGINPYLALQSLGGAGSGSVSPAGTWSSSPYGNKVSMESAKASAKSASASEKNANASMIRAIAGISTAVLAVIMMMI